MSKQTIGFIGVGLMGHGMAKNIVEKGWPLVVMGHRNRAPVDDLVRRGAKEAGSPKELATQVDIVHICVTGSPQVESLIRGPDGIIASGKKGLIVVDCSTADPVSTLTLAGELKAAGMAMVDAPLSRTPKEAEEGTLDCMVGADAETFVRVRPVIECWSTNINHLGELGLGHKMKLINNFVAMGYAALYAEALALGQKSGLTATQFQAVLGSSRMRNGFYDTFMKWTIEGDPDAHKFTIANAHKDMRYLASMANAAGCVNPMQSVVKNLFAGMEAKGEGSRFVPMLADHLLEMNGLTPRARKG